MVRIEKNNCGLPGPPGGGLTKGVDGGVWETAVNVAVGVTLGCGVVVRVGVAVGVGVLVGSGVLVGVAVSVAAGVARTSYCRSTWTVSPHQKSVEFTIEQLVFRAGAGFCGSVQKTWIRQPSPLHITICWTGSPPPGSGITPKSWQTLQPSLGKTVWNIGLAET